MKTFFALSLLLLQTPAPTPAPAPAETPAPKPWNGTLAEGLREMQRLSEAEKPEDAIALGETLLAPDRYARWRESAAAGPAWKRTLAEVADPLLAAVGISEHTPLERAAVQFTRGVVLARAKKNAEAAESFESARALSGAGDLRLDATYDLGWTALEEGEAFRAQIPELGGGQGTPQSLANQLPGAAPGAAPAPEKPDPVELARAAYLKARGHFVERLKADGKDADTRANAELVQKRLRELAEIQKKREEEKKKQEQQKKDEKDQDSKDKDKDQKDKDKKDSEKKDQDKKDPNEKPKDDPSKQDPKSDEQKKKEDEAKQQDPKKDKDKKDAQPQSSKEELLTKEEIMRLLDTLKDREEEGKKLQERLRNATRARVKKDW